MLSKQVDSIGKQSETWKQEIAATRKHLATTISTERASLGTKRGQGVIGMGHVLKQEGIHVNIRRAFRSLA